MRTTVPKNRSSDLTGDWVQEYGKYPRSLGGWNLHWDEFMHWLYLPARLPYQRNITLPPNLEFTRRLIEICVQDGAEPSDHIYISAKRGFVDHNNVLNRPGFHCDGFGSNDLNYIWSDKWPTRVAEQQFKDISDDHNISMEQFEEQIKPNCVRSLQPKVLYRLDPWVVHATPEIPEGEVGVRGFLKVSIS